MKKPGIWVTYLVFSGAVLVLGASGIVAQLLLIRELLITFLSNELTIGIILANWLILEAAGSWLGRFIEKTGRKLLLFVTVTGVFSVCLPLAIYLTRTWKIMVGAGPGEGMGLQQIFLASFVILLPVCLTHGALFTFSCRLMASLSVNEAKAIGKVYFLETCGTIAGGLTFTFMMITLMNSFQAAFTLLIVNAAVCVFLYLAFRYSGSAAGHNEPGKTSGFSKLATIAGVIFLLISLSLLLYLEYAPAIQRMSISKQWQNQEVVHYQNSIYGNTVVVERGGEYTFFTDGVPVITVPTPDIAFVEEFAHLPLLFQSQPEKVLVISGGAGGLINELLKHPVKRIDYVELDPLILKLVRMFPTDLTDGELMDPKVHIRYRDGRLFLRETPDRYDVILLGLSDPQDLQVNRFFTRQFFSLVNTRLEKNGIIAFTLPGSMTYMSKELKDLNASILNTLKDAFAGVRVIPGDGYNLILASPLSETTSCGADKIIERYENEGLVTRYLNPSLIRYRLDPEWSTWFNETMIGSTKKLNEDFRPLAVYYSLSYWSAKFSPRYKWLLTLGGTVSMAFLAVVIGFVVLLLFFPALRSSKPLGTGLPFAIAATGLAGMVLELALMFSFQALYGIVFYWIGFLITSFMTGVAAGSLVMVRWMEHMRSYVPWFIVTEAAVAAFSVLLPLLFYGSQSFLRHHYLILPVQILFLVFSMLSGLLIGLQFPLAGKIYLGLSGNVGTTAGQLYGADLMGGWAGGIVGGVVLLPVLGLVNTCLFLGILKLASGLLVTVGGWKEKQFKVRSA